MSLVAIRKSGSYYRIRPSTRLTTLLVSNRVLYYYWKLAYVRRLDLHVLLLVWIRGPLSLETKTGFRSDWVFKRQDSNFWESVYIQLYTVGHRSQSSDGQWNFSLGTIHSVSTRGRSLDGVDSSGDKTPITTIPTVGVYSSSDKTTIATIPAFQDDLLKCWSLGTIRPWIRVNVVELI